MGEPKKLDFILNKEVMEQLEEVGDLPAKLVEVLQLLPQDITNFISNTKFNEEDLQLIGLLEQAAVLYEQATIPLASQGIPFGEILKDGNIPRKYLETEPSSKQFVERLIHYVLSVRTDSFHFSQLRNLFDQLNPDKQVFFFKRLEEVSPKKIPEFQTLLLDKSSISDEVESLLSDR